MSPTTIVWSVGSGICLALAGVHLLVWIKSRQAWANLVFSIAALMAAITAQCELRMYHAATAAEYGRWFWLLHTPLGILIIALAWFAYLYLRAGRLWLLWLPVALRSVLIVANLFVRPNLNFYEISGLHRLQVWGETVAVPIGTPRPWNYLLGGSALLLMVFVVDASITAWRRGRRRQGAIIGGTITIAVLLGLAISQLHDRSLLAMPYTMSLPFLVIVLGVAYDLSLDLANARQVSLDLEQSQERMRLAARAVGLSMWDWDIDRDEIWMTEVGRARSGLGEAEPGRLARYLETLHPVDRPVVDAAVRQARHDGKDFDAEYRMISPDGTTRWLAATGKVERAASGRPRMLRGIAVDITKRKMAEDEIGRLGAELTHVQRVSGIGQLSSALAHELNQPLGAILRNAEAAELFLKQDPPDLEEVQDILADIQRDERRAIAVIERMRQLLRRQEPEFRPLAVDQLLDQLAPLVSPEFQARGARLDVQVPRDLPRVTGEAVHLQQVFLNLLLNGLDAVENQPKERQEVVITASRSGDRLVELAVTDRGAGIPPDLLPRIFEPFYTTKPRGIGIGLAISKTIVESHGGQITAQNEPAGGATFRFTLRVAEGRPLP